MIRCPDPDYEAWLEWFDGQPCLFCYEDNKHCVCQMLDERFGDIPPLTDDDYRYDSLYEEA